MEVIECRHLEGTEGFPMSEKEEKTMKKRWISLLLCAALSCSVLGMTGCGGTKGSDADTFSYWIFTTDGGGTYYEKYEQNPAVEWLNQQYWDVENHTLGDESSGEHIEFTFQSPISGAEQDNFNTMISTGEYTDIIDLVASTNSAETLHDEGIVMEITEYVEKYMPDYLALLEEHPDWKAQVTSLDENGDIHYYYLPGLKDGPPDSWNCFAYRRDWVVAYAEPTEYVWDWDSEYVKENGHPAVTPLETAQREGNLEGWKKNELYGTKFTSSEGQDPKNDYTDNVIFPSGKTEPYTISDWEWMLEAFEKAVADRGWSEDPDAYGISVYYTGFFGLGDLVSSFGGGTGTFYKNAEGTVIHSGTTDNFKSYIECMNQWYENGWLDTRFETRASDMFFSINETGYTQGKVGMWEATIGVLGDTIRVTCQDERDQKNAYVKGCALPVNDVYGTDEQKFTEPDAMYQAQVGPDGGIAVTEKAEGKNLAALFTYFNWCYTWEGGLFNTFGLSKEQYESVELENDLYEEYGLTDGMYHIEESETGKVIVKHLDPATGLDENAFLPCRMISKLSLTGHGEVDYSVDTG